MSIVGAAFGRIRAAIASNVPRFTSDPGTLRTVPIPRSKPPPPFKPSAARRQDAECEALCAKIMAVDLPPRRRPRFIPAHRHDD